MHKKSVTISEITFPSIEAAAAHFGQSYRNVARRIQSGWSAEESLGLTPHKLKRPGKGIPITTSSGHFDSILDAGEHFGISHATIRKRLEMGWTPNQAVGLESHTKSQDRLRKCFAREKLIPIRGL